MTDDEDEDDEAAAILVRDMHGGQGVRTVQ